MFIKLMVVGLVVTAAVVAYKLWKAGKAVTVQSVVDGVKVEVKDAVAAAKPVVKAAVEKVITK